MNRVFTLITGFTDGKKVSAFIDFGEQPLPRQGEIVTFEALLVTSVTSVEHSLSDAAEDHGITLALKVDPSSGTADPETALLHLRKLDCTSDVEIE